MAEKYYGWIGSGGYKNVIIIENNEARVFNIPNHQWETDNYFLKAKWDPGSDFEEITKEEAEKIIKKLEG